jgi:hypothetical protein
MVPVAPSSNMRSGRAKLGWRDTLEDVLNILSLLQFHPAGRKNNAMWSMTRRFS